METTDEISLLSMLLPLAGIVFIIAIGVIFLNQQFQKNLIRQKLEQEGLKALHQQQLLRSSILAQEAERKRIAQDMHDELGATLSIARMHLIQLQQSGCRDAAVTDKSFDNIKNHLESAMVNMRRICHLLMPPQLEAFGLVDALEATAVQVNQASGISIEIVAEANFSEPDWMSKISLYRICLELINNTLKHAGARAITINLRVECNSLTCDYADDGQGIQMNNKNEGLGINGMLGRALSLGGTFESGNRREGGYYARIIIPMEAREHEMLLQ